MTAVLVAEQVRKVYQSGDGTPLEVLAGVDLEIRRGEFVAIVGSSGAGKSTLLHLLGALDRPTSGTVSLDGLEFGSAPAEQLARLRNERIGFIFQFHHLLREFSALENVMLPLLIAGKTDREAEVRANDLLHAVGLTERRSHRPAQLSGGEQQRVAVARALANDPRVVLADEPSGNLDHGNSERLHDLLGSLAREFETALVVVTHNRLLAGRADRVLAMEAGRLIPAADVEATS